MKKPVYLDYHATSPCHPDVIAAMLPYFSAEKFGNPAAKASLQGRRAAASLQDALQKIGNLVGAAAEDITLTSGATEANNLALLGAASQAPADRREILISAIEHDSIVKSVQELEKRGFILRYIPVTKSGFVDVNAARDMISDKTFLVSVMLANHEIGTLQPVADIAQRAHTVGALCHTDATQAAGKIEIDVAQMDVDMLSFSSHKLSGPVGIGALYVRPSPQVAMRRIVFGGRQQKLRAGTVPLALAVGFAAACDIALKHRDDNTKHKAALAQAFLQELSREGVSYTLNGAIENRLAGSLNICLSGINAVDVLLDLAEDVGLSAGAACTAENGKPSAVLQAIGLSDEDIAQSLRICMGAQTTLAEAQYAANTLAQYVLRKKSAAA